jgi:uncharacterized OB-fold protein
MDIGVIRADDRSAPFFAAAARDVLLIKRCARCDRWLDPGATGCPECGAADPRWEQAAGHGRLISWAVLPAGKPDPVKPPGRSGTPGEAGSPGDAEASGDIKTSGDIEDAGACGAPDTSSMLALVELDEGPWLRTRLEGTGATGTSRLRPGLRVTAHFVHPAEGESYPVFRAAE